MNDSRSTNSTCFAPTARPTSGTVSARAAGSCIRADPQTEPPDPCGRASSTADGATSGPTPCCLRSSFTYHAIRPASSDASPGFSDRTTYTTSGSFAGTYAAGTVCSPENLYAAAPSNWQPASAGRSARQARVASAAALAGRGPV